MRVQQLAQPEPGVPRSHSAARIACSLATFWMSTKRLEEGTEWFERVLAAPSNDPLTRGGAYFDAGLLLFWQGRDEEAAELHRRAVEVGREIGDPTVTALGLTGLARIALRSDVEEARQLCRDALEIAPSVGDIRGRSNAVHVLGVAAQMNGDLAEARDLMSERMQLVRELGSYAGVASEAGNLSIVERQLGHLERAEALSREALDIAWKREDEWLLPYLLSGLAAIAVARSDDERGAMLIGAAETMMESQGTAWPPDEKPHYEETLAQLQESMGNRFDRVCEAGRSLRSQEAVAFALAPAD